MLALHLNMAIQAIGSIRFMPIDKFHDLQDEGEIGMTSAFWGLGHGEVDREYDAEYDPSEETLYIHIVPGISQSTIVEAMGLIAERHVVRSRQALG